VRMMGLLWAQLEHHIAIGCGVSDKTYSSNLENLLYGIGKEGCASPIICTLLNQLIMTFLGEKFDCIRLVAGYKEEEHVRPGESFIDDTTAGVKNYDTTMEPVPAEVKELTQSKEDFIGKI
jgi:hypothetical protein